jgi:hypothetical protein
LVALAALTLISAAVHIVTRGERARVKFPNSTHFPLGGEDE